MFQLPKTPQNRSQKLVYDNPKITRTDLESGQPFITQITDRDGEIVQLEWNGGAVIVSTPNLRVPTKENGMLEAISWSCSTPNIPYKILLDEIDKLAVMGIKSEGL